MNIYVLKKKTHELVDIIDDYESIIWTLRYNQDGDFELVVPVTDKTVNALQIDNILYREVDARHPTEDHQIIAMNPMVIEKIQITTDSEEGNRLIVTGRTVSCILKRRVLYKQTILTGSLYHMIYRLLRNECMDNWNIDQRLLPFFTTVLPNVLYHDLKLQLSAGDNLGETIESLAKQLEWTYSIYLYDTWFSLSLWQGRDLSYDQTANPFVVFSPRFDNLLTSEYLKDVSEYAMSAVVAGEGEGVNRKVQGVTFDADAKGVDKWEIHVDARDLQSNNGEISPTEYKEMLINRGGEKLLERQIKESFSGEAIPDVTFKFGEDYRLGDIVQVENEYGMSTKARIIEVIDSEDSSGRTVIPKFTTEV